MRNDKRELDLRRLDEIQVSDELKRRTILKCKDLNKGGIVMKRRWAAAVMTLIVSIFAFTYVLSYLRQDKDTKEVSYELTQVQSKKEFLSMINKKLKEQNDGIRLFGGRQVAEKAADSSAQNNSKEHSSTNVQVEGIDEADIIKTDGQYIYVINFERNELNVYTAEEKPKKIFSLKGEGILGSREAKEYKGYKRNIGLQDMFLYKNGNKNYLVIMSIVSRYKENPEQPSLKERVIGIMPIYYGENTTLISVYDVSNIEKVNVVKQYEITGDKLSARLKDGKVYLVTNKGFYYYFRESSNSNNLLPYYIEYGQEVEKKEIDVSNIRYNKQDIQPNYTIISAIDINKNTIDNQVVLGYFENMYMSNDSLYLVKTAVNYKEIKQDSNKPNDSIAVSIYDEDTVIYKFDLGEKVEYRKFTTVKGRIINQFSMDEYDGYFRIATTESINQNNKFTTTNNVYVIDKNMNVVGKINNIAPDERIYSTRFVKDKLYMVTFKQVDPLFVIDLKNPRQPKILGLLKIPGYSTYLHPYDENTIIGFGMDTGETEGRVVNKGMKVAIFDVKDVNNPKQKDSIEIGGKGTFSESLYNHKALVEYRKYNLYAFELYETKDDDSYVLDFAGLCLMQIENGRLNVKAKISHSITSSQNEYKEPIYGYRAVFVDNLMFVISSRAISVINLDNMKEVYRGNI
ncbi:beta-propeller domain-containing protein [Caloramator proteoclasticus]|uniref:Secreted protein containing C-terminal beta-propeller domain n=1 Tax=Caloramator proteoclasticus DSM 10124 TaxID=1121262 RepID=A0A1M4Y3I8_9CLOT|nr:beta-propeller domain-containing protein [Caloramator proteoclasticus]SHF00265.1 Secreted protein containing C-terminal beta-propeller domain [Caloramator proteoclasticus DSM 10124]